MGDNIGSSTGTTSLHLPASMKLTGEENWPLFKDAIENLLDVNGLGRFISAKAKPPNEVDDEDENGSPEYTKWKEWKASDSKAKLILLYNVDKSLVGLIRGKKTAKEMMDSLNQRYEGSGWVTKYHALVEFYTIKYDDFDSLTEFIVAYRNAIEKMETLEIHPQQPLHYTMLFIAALSTKFEIWAERQRSLARTAAKPASLDDLIADISDEARHSKDDPSGALYIGKGKSRDRGDNKKKCSHCKKRHFGGADRCFVKYPHLRDEFKRKMEERQKTEAKEEDNKNNDTRQSTSGHVARTAQIGNWVNAETGEEVYSLMALTHPLSPPNTNSSLAHPTVSNAYLSYPKSGDWHADTGATHHFTNDRKNFTEYRQVTGLPPVSTGNGYVHPQGTGTIIMKVPLSNGKVTTLMLLDVLYMPEFPVNLFSGVKLYMADGYLKRHAMYDKDNVELAQIDTSSTGMRLVLFKERSKAYPAALQQAKLSEGLLHRRLAHVSFETLRKTLKVTYGYDKPPPENNNLGVTILCDSCEKSRPVQTIRRTAPQVTEPLAEIIFDVVTVRPKAWNGDEYATLSTDAATRARWGHAHKEKGDAYNAVRSIIRMIRTQYKVTPKRVRIDGGPEFMDKLSALKKMFERAGIKLILSTPHSPWMVGKGERANRIIMDRMRAMMIDMAIPKHFWNEVFKASIHITNKVSNSRLQGCITPYEALMNFVEPGKDHKPSIAHLRVVGCEAYVQIPKERRIQSDKTGERAEKGILLGFEGNHIYRVWIGGRTRSLVRSANVNFNEGGFLSEVIDDTVENAIIDTSIVRGVGDINDAENEGNEDDVEITHNADVNTKITRADLPSNELDSTVHRLYDFKGNNPPSDPTIKDELGDESLAPIGADKAIQREDLTNINEQADESDEHEEATPVAEKRGRGRPKGSTKKAHTPVAPTVTTRSQAAKTTPSESPHANFAASASFKAYNSSVKDEAEPLTFKEAMECPDAPKWRHAMKLEVFQLQRNKTWQQISRKDVPPGTKVIPGKWVYRLKRDANGKIIRWKARWVAKGYEQRHGIDYDQTFAGVTKSMTWKAIIAMAATHDWEIEQMDVVTAFLHGEIDEDTYVEPPPVPPESIQEIYDCKDAKEFPTVVCKLLKALYGLKQSPRLWQLKLRKELEALGYVPIEADLCVYRNVQTNVIVVTYVDDFLLIGPAGEALDQLKINLKKVFEMQDLGPCNHFVGVRITRNRKARTITLCQDAFIDKILKRFGMEDCAPKSTPMDAGAMEHMVPFEGETSHKDREEYQSIVGSEMYLCTQTRPDIAFAMSILSRFLQNPSPQHIVAAKRVLRYLAGTKFIGIVYGRPTSTLDATSLLLHGYSDSNHGLDHEKRLSTSAYIFYLAGGPISWSAKRQKALALSTTDAEYYGMCNAAREAAWLRTLFSCLGYSGDDAKCVQIMGDNTSAIALAENPEFHARTKHIELQWHYVRDQQTRCLIDLQYIPTKEMVADGMTKPLEKIKHQEFLRLMNLRVIHI